MARIRTIKPDFFLHERLAEFPAHARLLFIGLWMLADKEGRLADRPKKIKAELFPWEDVDVDDLLWLLASPEGLRPKEQAFIVRYEIDGEPFIAIPGFLTHQKPHHREANSTIKPPEKGSLRPHLGTAQAAPRHGSGPTKVGATEKPSNGAENGLEAVPRQGPDPTKARLSRVDRGKESMGKDDDAGEVSTNHEQQFFHERMLEYVRGQWPGIESPETGIRVWTETYPGLDLLAEAKLARAHEVSSGETRKIPAAFLNSWFREAQKRRVSSNGEELDDGGMAKSRRLRAESQARIDEIKKRSRENRDVKPPPRSQH